MQYVLSTNPAPKIPALRSQRSLDPTRNGPAEVYRRTTLPLLIQLGNVGALTLHDLHEEGATSDATVIGSARDNEKEWPIAVYGLYKV